MLEAFRNNTNCAKDQHKASSHVGTRKNVLEENMTRPEKVKKMSQKQPKLKGIIHAFEVSRGLIFERNGMPLRDMVCHWKGVMWHGTNI